jgi:protease I
MNLGKLLMLVGPGFNEAEALYPYYRFQEAGYKVDPVGPKAKETLTGMYGFHFAISLHDTSDIIKGPEEVNVNEYDGVIIPGGRGPDSIRMNKPMVNIVKEAFNKGKVVAAICHGPSMLVEADVLRGKRATCWPSVSTDVKNAGANYEDRSVVVDGNLVTSRFPNDLPDFCRETLKLLKK